MSGVKMFEVRMSYMERCYVERDFYVLARDAEEAERKALAEEGVIDEGEEHTCEPLARYRLALAVDPWHPHPVKPCDRPKPTPEQIAAAEAYSNQRS